VRTSSVTPQPTIVGRSRTAPKRILRYKGNAWVVTQFPTKAPVEYPRKSGRTGWTVDSVRSGVIAKKLE